MNDERRQVTNAPLLRRADMNIKKTNNGLISCTRSRPPPDALDSLAMTGKMILADTESAYSDINKDVE